MLENKKLLVTLCVDELKELINECLSSTLGITNSKTANKDNNTELISRFDACRMFGVSRTTIDKWRKYKLLPREIKIASRVYFNKQELIELINKKGGVRYE
jgi:predicted DNA-binding transcriptional regulator AlpA